MSSSPLSRPDSMRLAHKAQHTIRSHSAQVSNPITMHVLFNVSQSLVSTPWGPLSTSSVSTSRHVVPRTQPICSPSRRGMLHPPSQIEKSPSTVTPRLGKSLSTGHSNTILSQPAPDQTAHEPLTVSHDANARHSKRVPTHPRVRVHYGSVPSRRGTSSAGHTPQATPSCRGTRPTSQVEESTSCVCIPMSLSNPNHTT